MHIKKWILLLTYFSDFMHLTSLTCIFCIGSATLSLQSHGFCIPWLGGFLLCVGKWSPSIKWTATEMVDFLILFTSATWYRDLISTIYIRTHVYIWLNILDASEVIVVEVLGVSLLEQFFFLKFRMLCDLPKSIFETARTFRH